MKFEHLSLEKFTPYKISSAKNILGGTATTPTVPNGGCSCSTGGGTLQLPNTSIAYQSDTTTFNADGTQAEAEYHTNIE